MNEKQNDLDALKKHLSGTYMVKLPHHSLNDRAMQVVHKIKGDRILSPNFTNRLL